MDIKPRQPQETFNSHIPYREVLKIRSLQRQIETKWNKSTELLLSLLEILITCASSLLQAVHHETGEQTFKGHHVISGHVIVKPCAWTDWGIHVSMSIEPHVLIFLTSHASDPCLNVLAWNPMMHWWIILLSFKMKLFYFSISIVAQLFSAALEQLLYCKDNPAKVCMNGVWVKPIKNISFMLSL